MRVFIEFMPALGDLVTQLPILHALRARDPELEVEVLLTPGIAGLLDDYGWIHRRYLRDGSWSMRTGPFRSGLRRPFDLLLYLRKNPALKVNRILVRARRKLGPEAQDPALRDAGTVLKRYSILRYVLDDLPEPDTRIVLDPARHAEALSAAGTEEGTRLLCVGPGVSRRERQWPVERFAALVERIGASFDEVRVLGSPAEAELCSRLAELCGGRSLAGIPLTRVAALLATTTLYVGNDSGLSHLAGAQGCPAFSVALTHPGYAPWGGAGLEGVASRITVDAVADRLRREAMIG